MKQNITHSRNSQRIADNPENPSPAPAHPARTRPQDAPDPKPPAETNAPPWKNLTLAEMRTWLEATKRREAEQIAQNELR